MKNKIAMVPVMVSLTLLSFGSLDYAFARKPPAKKVETKGSPQPAATSEEALIAPWDHMNSQFRKYYSEARSNRMKELGPVVVFNEGKMNLHYKGKIESVNTVQPKYTLLKSVAHIPLTIFVILADKTDKPLNGETIAELTKFKQAFVAASENLKSWKLIPEQEERQNKMIEQSTYFLDTVVKGKTVSKNALLEFTREMGKDSLSNAYDAAGLELSLIDTQLKKWRETISDDDWKKLRISVLQPHMPHDDNRVIQYFLKLFKEEQEGNSIVYGEGSSDENFAIELLGTHMLDKEIAVYFFKDPWRMHRDLLADGARRYLKEHPPTANR